MKNQLQWLKSLPFGLALKLTAMSAVRKLTGLPIAFSFAQGAEDILIPYMARYHVGLEGPGNYVDVGCNAPVRFSNTFVPYLIGWRGLNIDANADLIEECRRVRKQDICVQAAVSDSEREVVFHKGKDDAVSTIDETRIVEWRKHFEFSEEDQEVVTTRTLTSVLDEFWEEGRAIDLLSVDVEGHDLQVLKSLDFVRYRPKLIVVEMHDFEGIGDSPIGRFLDDKGYSLKFVAVLNAYYVDNTLRTDA